VIRSWRSGRRQAAVSAFDDEFADELGERVEHVERESVAGGRGIDRLMQRSDADSAAPKVPTMSRRSRRDRASRSRLGTTRLWPGRRYTGHAMSCFGRRRGRTACRRTSMHAASFSVSSCPAEKLALRDTLAWVSTRGFGCGPVAGGRLWGRS
jgi:hypothetical protein